MNLRGVPDGKVYDVDFYNLDVIISVGYRVKSKRGTQFRIRYIMRFMDRLRQRLFIQEQMRKRISWDLPHLPESTPR